jgi:hypothetical protein
MPRVCLTRLGFASTFALYPNDFNAISFAATILPWFHPQLDIVGYHIQTYAEGGYSMRLKLLAMSAAMIAATALAAPSAMAQYYHHGGPDGHGGWHGPWRGGWQGHGYWGPGHAWVWYHGYGPAYGYYPPPVYYAPPPPPVYYAPPPPVYYAPPPPVYVAPPSVVITPRGVGITP